ncbi:MAG: two-component system response regulator OmpR [Candidatus Parabeggiatoa sp. nov. 3]|nr:MAG: two-component system response regulator OmpR [Gammaproteobacteria bacterium]RKZ60654.1 MAG: two-component system response regulator OmpR [Gammaproteobacteria bacterium]RKZ81984.1 MAG: two-component system response regulator OmpR [Gammaproteobacteria bacterium]
MVNQREQLLMVDDDRKFCQVVKNYFKKQGFQIDVVYDGVAMNQYLSKRTVDLIILDVMLPGENGLSLAQRLRATDYQQAIIMLSAATEEVDRIVGLEMGADNYLPKPVSLRELLAHVRASLRRNPEPAQQAGKNQLKSYTFDSFTLDTACHRLTKNEVELNITENEYSLLQVFVTHPHEILSREKLLNLMNGREYIPYDRIIDVNIKRLRDKIETEPKAPSYIRTIRGKGYLFSPQG